MHAEDKIDESQYKQITEELRNSYISDGEFLKEATDKGLSFEELVAVKGKEVYQSRNKRRIGQGESCTNIYVDSIGNDGRCVYANVPLIMQTSYYNCGPTSALQAIYGGHMQGNVPGTTDADKINYISSTCGTNPNYGTYVYKITNFLNNYNFYGTYSYFPGANLSCMSFQQKLENSLFYDMAPILHARTEKLKYYGGHRAGHYIAVAEVNKNSRTVTLQDCNNDYHFYGRHVVDISEAFGSVNLPDRYVICMD